MATPVTSSGNCSDCNTQFNEVTGEPITIAGKKFHEACLKCKYCRKRVRPGWTIVHPAGIFCNDICMQNTLKRAEGREYGPSCNDDKCFIVIDRCFMCWLPINEDRPETWIDSDGTRIHQKCFKCEACGTPPPPPKGRVILCALRFWCGDDCIQSANKKAVKVYYQPTKEAEHEARGGNDDPVNGGNVNDQCGVCNKPINEVPGEQPISCGEKQFHQSCFKCMGCDKRLEEGSVLMHPDGGLFCFGDYYFDRCMRSFGAKTMQVPYKPSCNDDNNFIVNNNCLVCKTPINKEHLETCVNCSGNIIHQECFKCKACETTPPPKGEIMALMSWFFCDDDCIGSFGEKAVKVNHHAQARAADATEETEDETSGESEEEMEVNIAGPASDAEE